MVLQERAVGTEKECDMRKKLVLRQPQTRSGLRIGDKQLLDIHNPNAFVVVTASVRRHLANRGFLSSCMMHVSVQHSVYHLL